MGLAWLEEELQPYDVLNADEAWLTSTPYCVAPCTKINNIPIGDGTPGLVYHRMAKAWSNLVGSDVVQQIMESAIGAGQA